jgi:hypothetical protein
MDQHIFAWITKDTEGDLHLFIECGQFFVHEIFSRGTDAYKSWPLHITGLAAGKVELIALPLSTQPAPPNLTVFIANDILRKQW